MWYAVSGGLKSQPWHHNNIWAPPYSNFPKFCFHLHRYNSVRVHQYAHPKHMKVLKHCIYIQYGCGMQSVEAYSLNHVTTMSFGLPLIPISKPFASTNHQHRYTSVWLHQYAQPQHMKVLKHFIYIQYGCGLQTAVVYSLNHDTTMSFGLRHTPILQNLATTCKGITV